MSKNIFSASIVLVCLALWLGSGVLSGQHLPEQTNTGIAQEGPRANPVDAGLSRVRVAALGAERRTRELVLRGRTESQRIVDVAAETTGRIVARPVERGMNVSRGDLLCEVAVDDRKVALEEAEAAFATARIEHVGNLQLRQQGLLSEVAIAGSEARQESARAHLQRQRLSLSRTRIVAPFSGVVETLYMNVGDYAVAGAPCARLIDLDPMLVLADVTESEVDSLVIGQRVQGSTSVGREVVGTVSFVGRQSDPVTRTYPVEITVDNHNYRLRSGLTVNLRIGVEEVYAHLVSPSLLTLSDSGDLGVRTLDATNRVVFSPVEIIEDGSQGHWITGLPSTVHLITVGHEYVTTGELVEPVYSGASNGQIATL